MTFTVEPSATVDTAAGLSTRSYRLGPPGVTFSSPATLRIPIEAAPLAGLARPGDLVGATLADGTWYGIPNSYTDGATSELVVKIDEIGPPTLVPVVEVPPNDTSRLPTLRTAASYRATDGRMTQVDEFAGLLPIYVDDSSPALPGDPGTDANPYPTLQQGIAAAGPGTKVVLLEGTYTPGLVPLPSHLRLDGVGGPVLRNSTILAQQSPSRAHVRGLAFDATGVNIGTYVGIYVTTGNPIFEGITSDTTAGIHVQAGSPRFLDCTLRQSAATVVVDGGAPTLEGCSLRDGFGIRLDGGDLTIRGGTIRTCQGVQSRSNGTLTIQDNCVLRENDPAGVVIHQAGHLVLADLSSVRDNTIGVLVGHLEADDAAWNGVRATCDARIGNCTIKENRSANLVLRTDGTVNLNYNTTTPPGPIVSRKARPRTTAALSAGTNTFDHDPPLVWAGPEPWGGRPDIADLFATGSLAWWKLEPQKSPSPRHGAAMGHAPQAGAAAPFGRAVLFGGQDASGNILQDTWLFDPRTFEWEEVTGGVPPPASMNHCMTRSETRALKCLLFGGRNPDTGQILGDLYRFDGFDGSWLKINPSGTRPGPRYGASFDRLDDDHFVLHGGIGPSGVYDDWWLYDGIQHGWTQVDAEPMSGDAPPPRAFHASAPTLTKQIQTGDPVELSWPNVLVTGGVDDNGSIDSLFRYARYGNFWWDLTPRSMPGLTASVMERTTNGSSTRWMLFGGARGGQVIDATYLLDETSPSSYAISELSFGEGERPPKRQFHCSYAWADAHGRRVVVVFGGVGPAPDTEVYGDTWIFTPTGG